MKITAEERKAIEYYEGDVSGNDPFWSDPKAYVVLNSLFFPDITTEAARSAEGKYLNPAILEDTERLITVYRSLLSVCRKTAMKSDVVTYRVERLADYQYCKKAGRTISFTSTSASGFLREYQDRAGIVLMRFHIPAATPCIPFADVLDKYAKSDEAEILLPPWLHLEINEILLTSSEKQILDANGKPPELSCVVNVLQNTSPIKLASELPENGSEAGQRVYNALNSGCIPSADDVRLYCAWKQALSSQMILYLNK